MLEVGGTHVDSGLVDLGRRVVVPGSRHRRPLRPDTSVDAFVAALLAAAADTGAGPGRTWGVAIPGPFDYDAGVARFRDVGKFDALRGVDVGRLLREGLPQPDDVVFVNDANAFLLGEWAAGAARGHTRAAGLTLGTGIGSAFLADTAIVESHPALPHEGRACNLLVEGRPLEEHVSRRALVGTYARLTGDGTPIDVDGIAARARRGEPAARRVLEEAMARLGRALAPCLDGFGATVLVVGGAISGSWDLLAHPLWAGLVGARPALDGVLEVVRARRAADAGLVGAAVHAGRSTTRPPFPASEPGVDMVP